jgi:hypothetical protein
MTDASELSRFELGRVLQDAAITTIRNFPLFAGIAVLSALAELAGAVAAVPSSHVGHIDSPIDAQWAFRHGLSFILWLVAVLASAFCSAALCLAAFRLKKGETCTVNHALRMAFPYTFRVIWVGVLQGLLACWPLVFVMFFLFAVIAALPPMLGSVPSSNTMTISAIVLGVLLMLPLYARYVLAIPAAIQEDLAAFRAIDRSVSLGAGFRWKVLLGTVAFFSLYLPFGAATWWIEHQPHTELGMWGNTLAWRAIEGLPGFFESLLVTPLLMVMSTFMYLRLVEIGNGIRDSALLVGCEGTAGEDAADRADHLPAPSDEE